MTIKHCIESLKKKGLYFCLQETSKYLFPIRWISDKSMMDNLYQKRTYNYLKRKYIPMLDKFSPCEVSDSGQSSPVWVAWLQGEEAAPPLVRKCIDSIRKHAGNREVRVVTWNNLDSYIDIPDYIIERLNHHQMQFAQFSDYIRIALLCKYGGIWVDATVLLTAPIPDEISGSPLFFFRSAVDNSPVIRNSSWFIVSCPGNPVVQKMKYLLECYWQREHKLKDYFILHLFLSCLVDSDEECREIWNNMHFVGNMEAHRMQSLLFEQYSEKLFDDICSGSTIHKLTYKFKNPDLTGKKGTVYDHLMNDLQIIGN